MIIWPLRGHYDGPAGTLWCPRGTLRCHNNGPEWPLRDHYDGTESPLWGQAPKANFIRKFSGPNFFSRGPNSEIYGPGRGPKSDFEKKTLHRFEKQTFLW